MMRRLLQVMLPVAGLLAISGEASAQETQVTGPLAGAPAVRGLRLHRKGRFELAPAISFTLLDEYQRTILVGARINYNITDWLAIGAWGAFGAVKTTTGLSSKLQDTNDARFKGNATSAAAQTDRRLTDANVGQDFKAQLGAINWVIAPQITAVPFRGKLAIFQKIFVDTDAYFFAGPAFVNVTERANCGDKGSPDCSLLSRGRIPPPGGPGTFPADEPVAKTKEVASRLAIAPTFGVGLNFYTNKWTSVGLEWRALPFAWNTGGFDTRGGGQNGKFPDNKIDDQDRQFKFNQMITISLGFYLPTEMKVSE